MMPRWREPATEVDAGFTLAELLVVITLFGVLGSMVAATTIQSLQSSRRTQDKAEADALLRTTLEQLSRDVRVADPLQDGATATALTVDVARSGGCERRTYALDAGTLAETVQEWSALSTSSTSPGCVGTAGATRTREIVRGLSSASTFTYFLEAGTSAPDPVIGEDVAKVRITLERELPEGRPAATLTTEVDLRNHR